MTRFSNEEEGLERRAEKYYEYDDEENNYNEDGDELKPTRTMLMTTTMMTMRMTTRLMTRTKAMMRKKLTMAIQRVTQKMRKLILGINCEKKLSVTWFQLGKNRCKKIYIKVCQRMMLRLKVLNVCFLFTAESYESYIYMI